jgi:hypothetical protein
MRLTISQAVLRKQPGDCSGAAQAARCIAYTAQCHPNVGPIRNYEVVGIELQTDWIDLTVAGGEHHQKPLASANAADARTKPLASANAANTRTKPRASANAANTRTKPLASANAADSAIAFDCLKPS